MDKKSLELHDLLLNDRRLKQNLSLLDFDIHELDKKGRKKDLEIAPEFWPHLTTIGDEGTGGLFAFWQPDLSKRQSSIVFIDSEGFAGRISDSLVQLIQLATTYPTSWHSVPWFSGKAVSTMRKSLENEEKQNMAVSQEEKEFFRKIGHDPDYAEKLKLRIQHAALETRELLNLRKQRDLLERVSAAINAKPQFILYSAHGDQFEQFGG